MKLLEIIKSKIDKTEKFIFQNLNNSIFETSVIRKGDGKDIVCIPTQTNCKMGCQFCHLTGIDLPVANLKSEEIEQLVWHSLKFAQKQNDILLVSYMGAGEPLTSINTASNVCASACFIKQSTPFINLGYKNIKFAISTIIPNKTSFNHFTETVKDWKLPMKIHWSLHSVRENRRTLMPAALNIKNSLSLLNEYVGKTNNSVEIHYTLMNDINDTDEDIANIDRLIDKKFNFKILKFAELENNNLSSSSRTLYFKSELEKKGFNVEIYSPPGEDIGAACGQFLLRNYKI